MDFSEVILEITEETTETETETTEPVILEETVIVNLTELETTTEWLTSSTTTTAVTQQQIDVERLNNYVNLATGVDALIIVVFSFVFVKSIFNIFFGRV